jgi:hypothetical protein
MSWSFMSCNKLSAWTLTVKNRSMKLKKNVLIKDIRAFS